MLESQRHHVLLEIDSDIFYHLQVEKSQDNACLIDMTQILGKISY